MSDDPEKTARIRAIMTGLQGNGAARRSAMGQLYDELAGTILRFLSEGTSRAEAEDLLHEVFVRVIDGRAGLDREPLQFLSWIWTVTRNIRTDWYRKTGRREFIEFDETSVIPGAEQQQANNPECAVLEYQLRDCIEQAYAQFRNSIPDGAQTLSWLVTDEIKSSGIARILGRSEDATRQYLFQCRKKLYAFLDRCRQFH